MAVQTAHHAHRCGACAQSFRLRPERVTAGTGDDTLHALRCPFCGFLNHPHPAPTRTRTVITLVRPPEPELQPAAVPAVTLVSGHTSIRKAAARLRKRPASIRPAAPKPVFGTIFEPAAV